MKNLENGKEIDDQLSRIDLKITKEGDKVTAIKKRYPVLNLACASCASSSQEILKNQKGVISASVNFANAMAYLEYNPAITDEFQLKKALQSVGYDLMTEEDEKAEESLDEYQNQQHRSQQRKSLGAIILSIPLVTIAMVPTLMNLPFANFLLWALSTPVVIWFGRQFFIGAFKQILHRSANMDTLVALSTGVAYLFSVFNTLFPDYWHQKGLHAHVYFEAAAVVIAFILIGKLLEEKAKGNTSSALKKLIGLRPKSVTITDENGGIYEIPVANIRVGDLLLVKPGEKIAVDGIVTNGNSFVDESMLSGEPIPVEKTKDGYVFAGTINQKGSFQYKALKVGGDTLLSQIIKMVQDAQGSKAPVQQLADKIARIFVPVVVSIALITLIVWIIFGGENGFTQGLLAMITVLVIACPCALGLATPTAIMVGIGKGAELGILIRDTESLEIAKRVNTIVFDKTGTITEGKPEVTDIKWLETETEENRSILFSIEKLSEHPLAEAIVNYLGDTSFFNDEISIENISGKGIKGVYRNKRYTIGNEILIKENNIPINQEVTEWITNKTLNANSIVLFSDGNKVLAVISIADRIKESSPFAIKKLKEKGLDVYMLTGDNEQTAKVIARHANIEHYNANCLPVDKSEFIKELQKQGKIVAMIGDGINDSSALAQADLSIAMGQGSDIALDVAKMTIISSDLNKIIDAIALSKQTVLTINHNLFWAFFYNIIAIPIAAGILYPINGFLLNPMIAGAAMALSSVSVVTNSLLLKIKRI